MRTSAAKLILLTACLSSLLFITCRDRDTLLDPVGPEGYLDLAVHFSAELAEGMNLQRPGEATLAATISSMDAEVYDESGGAPLSLGRRDLTINWDDSTFSGSLTVTAGRSRSVAVRAKDSRGVTYLGVRKNLTVVEGDRTDAQVMMNLFVPEVVPESRYSETGIAGFRLSQISLADSYILQYGLSSSFTAYDSTVIADGQTTAVIQNLGAGRYYFRAYARNNYALGSPGDTVSVAVKVAPQINILSPSSNAEAQSGENVLFLAEIGSDAGLAIGNGDIAWHSTRAGIFAAGSLAVNSGLSTGSHQIYVTAETEFGLFNSDTVALSVVESGNVAPQVVLEYPADGSSFNYGDNILFISSGVDGEDGILDDGRFYWLENFSEVLGAGRSFEYSSLPVGQHHIQVVGIDHHGAAGLDSIVVTVVSSGANTAPEPQIVTPVESAVFAPGTPVLFQGAAQDGEEGLIGWSGLAWESSIDGPLGTGALLTRADLTPGDHKIFLTAVDNQGAAARDSVSIRIAAGGLTPLDAHITLPQDGFTFQQGSSIVFSAETNSSGSAIESWFWYSSATGVLGEGQLIQSAELPLGTHEVYLAAVAASGQAALDSVTVGIVSSGGNLPPQVVIGSPVEGTSYNRDALIYLSATAVDPEDGELSSDKIRWYSDVEGYLGLGVQEIDIGSRTVTLEERFVSGLALGSHRLQAVATDDRSASGMDSVRIEVVSSGGAEPPTAEIVLPLDGASFNADGGILFEAQVTGLTDQEISSGSVWWSSSAAGRFGQGVSWVEFGLPLGQQKIYLNVVNSLGVAARDSVTITLVSSGANAVPIVTLLSPEPLSTWPSDEEIPFIGIANDPESGTLPEENYRWYSNATGLFARGSFALYAELPDGVQTISLVAVDESGAAGVDSISITVGAASGNTAPLVEINYPADGSVFDIGTAVLFSGNVTDNEDGRLSGEHLSWYSSRVGFLGNGELLTSNDLPEGEHRILLVATDAGGLSGAAGITITIQSGGNRSPQAEIVSPANGAVFRVSQPVTFSGNASDPDQGILSGESMTWSSSLDGVIQSGASFSADDLSSGRHLITLLAVDNQGAAAFDTVSIVVSNPPQVEITSPADGSTFAIGAPVEFSGTATDPEEGVVSPDRLVWYSSLEDAAIGVGASFVTRSLRIGTHAVMLIASDRLGIADTAYVGLSVVAVPDSQLVSVSVGQGTQQIAVNLDDMLAYFSNGSDNTVSIVSLESFSETNRIGVGQNPNGLAFASSLGRVYVANSSADNIAVIDGGSLSQTIPVGFQPQGVAISIDQSQVYVSNSNSASVSIISASEGTVSGTIQNVGNSPGSLLVPPPGGRLFVANFGSRDAADTSPDEVAVFSIPDGTLLKSIRVGNKPVGLSSDSEGRIVALANSGSGTVSLIDGANLTVLSEVTVGTTPTGCAFTPDGQQLYVVNSVRADISVIDVASKTVVETISDVGVEPYGIAIYEEPSGGRSIALISDRASGRVYVIEVR